jgi:hypothetical protein
MGLGLRHSLLCMVKGLGFGVRYVWFGSVKGLGFGVRYVWFVSGQIKYFGPQDLPRGAWILA